MKYEDASDNNFPNDYDKSKVDNRIKLRTDKVEHSMWGDNVREAVSQGVQIGGAIASEANDIANKANGTSQSLQKQFDNQINGQDKDNESKDARISQADGKTYDTLKHRLDAMDKKPQQMADSIVIGGTNLLLDTDFYLTEPNGTHNNMKMSVSNQDLVGKAVTFSLDVNVDNVRTVNDGNTMTRALLEIKLKKSDGTFDYYGCAWQSDIKIGASHHGRVSTTWNIPADKTYTDSIMIIEGVYTQGFTADSIKVGHPKIEFGTKATDWTPAPEDSHHHEAFRKGTRFFAHRGAQSIAPENSLPAIRKAGNHAGVEIDIHTTSDGAWVVMHDGTVDRMTNGHGAVSSFTFDQIRKLRIDAGSRLSKYSDADKVIPTLEEVLLVCKDQRLIPVVEIKVDSTDNYTATNWDSLANIITKFGLQDEMMFISFNYQALVEVKKRLPSIEVSWLVNDINSNNILQAQRLGVNSGLDVNYASSTMTSATSNNVKLCHDAGLKVGAWTLNNDDRRANLIGQGVDFITTNSLSGERRWANLIPHNGWVNYNDEFDSVVQEVAPGIINVHFVMQGNNGNATKGVAFAELPDWAAPSYIMWNPCILRTHDTAVATSFDISGKNLLVGLNWDKKFNINGWVSGNITYHV